MCNDTESPSDRTASPLEPRTRPASTVRAAIDHVRIDVEDAPDECALFPRNAGDERLERAWIVAQGASFVDLESMA